ncbi:ATP-binding cassette sub-family G member 1-like [Chironomus tepperi]|uniref:ATP-binding cassette sub-family G member 1-like n=1 Tax=Chironomus tepperi TaxID=113505 RepID=UPI00391F6CD8
MDPILQQDTALNTIAALSMSAMKADNNHTAINKHVQTEYIKGSVDATDYANSPSAVRAAFFNLPVCEPIEISFKDVSYCVQKMFSKTRKEILHKVSGNFPSGNLIAIMGPSGAGKSTLLNALSGYKTRGVSGAIYVNGRIRDLNEFKKSTCYITQDDRLQLLLTVYENMKIAADLKLGNNVSLIEKNSRIENILTALGLYDHQFTITERLSGGQKKRLSVALELINNPTVLWLDEPTTGLDSYSCTNMIAYLKQLAQQGRTVICTIHQPSAKLFEKFDLVYILAYGKCLYQGHSSKLVPFLQSVSLPCPKFHNPADYAIELASGDYGMDKVKTLSNSIGNGECLSWYENPNRVMKLEQLRQKYPISDEKKKSDDVSEFHKLKVLLRRGVIKTKRDQTLTHLRIIVNVLVAVLLGLLFIGSGTDGSRVLANYNLMFAILIHHVFAAMMLTILTFPTEKSIILKENFNRWYSVKSYYISTTLIDLPVTIISCLLFSIVIYIMVGWPLEADRFSVFFVVSFLIVFIAQSIGLLIGTVCNVINGTFLGPILAVPAMMLAGFGVTLKDLPPYLYWGSYVSYLRYGLEGYVGALFYKREQLKCDVMYCHYKYPEKFLKDISMEADQFQKDIYALLFAIVLLRVLCYYLLKWRIVLSR